MRFYGALSMLPFLFQVSVSSAQDSVGATTAPDLATLPANRNYVAVVIGLSSYKNLPDEVELDFARSDAAVVAKQLREHANFNHVYLLADGEATRENVLQTLRTKVAQVVGPEDVFVLYFVGHGIGAQVGSPYLLIHDSTLEGAEQDALAIPQFAQDLQTWTPAGTALIVTDAIHRNQLDGFYFYGPAADEWPQMPQNTMILSSSASQIAAKDGQFGTVFAEGIGGNADMNRDKMVTASELFTFLINRLSPNGQIPVASGSFDGNMVLAQDVTHGAIPTTGGTQPTDVVTVYPEYLVPKAKFVWQDGVNHLIQCREQEKAELCSDSCYLWSFKAGPCQLKALYDGTEFQGEVVVLDKGAYHCTRVGAELKCEGPR